MQTLVETNDAPTRDGRTRDAGHWLAKHSVDIVFAGLVLVAFAYAVHLTRHAYFLIDDWRLIKQGGTIGGLFKPYNDHLSIIILAIYRGSAQLFGLDYTAPRIIGLAILYAVPAAYFFTARRRFGPTVSAILALPLLWYGKHVDLFSGAFNHYLVLLAGIVCADALMRGRRADGVLLAAVAVSLLSAGGGVAVVAACVVHNACTRPWARRWIVVLVPAGLWFFWWLIEQRRLNSGGRYALSLSQTLRFMRNLAYTPFEAVALGSAVIAVLLGLAYVAYGVWTVSKGLRHGANFLAWTAANLVWSYGIANNRSVLADVNAFRYRYLALGFALLAIVPRDRVRWPSRFPLNDRRWLAAGALLLLVLGTARALVTAGDMRDSAKRLSGFGRVVRTESLVLALRPPVISDHTQMGVELGSLSAGDMRALFARYGDPIATSPARIDAQLVARHLIRAVPHARGHAPCVPVSDTVRITPAQSSRRYLWTRDAPVTIEVRRFGDRFVPLTTMPPGVGVQIAFSTVGSNAPVELRAPGACIAGTGS